MLSEPQHFEDGIKVVGSCHVLAKVGASTNGADFSRPWDLVTNSQVTVPSPSTGSLFPLGAVRQKEKRHILHSLV